MGTQRSGRRFASLALAGLAGLVGLGAAELVLAVAAPDSNLRTTAGLNIYVADSALGYRLQPHVRRRFAWLGRDIVIRTDALGHRVPAGVAGPPGDQEVVFAGDSFVFGNEVQAEEAFPWLVGETIGVRPVNLGVGGYSLGQSAGLVERYLRSVPPGRITRAFLVVYIGNDLEWGASPPPSRVDGAGYLIDPAAPRPATGRGPLEWLIVNSRVAFYAHKAYRAARPRPVVPAAEERASPPPPRSRWIYDPARLTPAALAGHREVLRDLARVAARAGVGLTVVLLPERGQVAGALSAAPNTALLHLLADLNLPAIDLLPAMQAATAAEGLFHSGRLGHLSPAGHRVVARILASAAADPRLELPGTPNEISPATDSSSFFEVSRGPSPHPPEAQAPHAGAEGTMARHLAHRAAQHPDLRLVRPDRLPHQAGRQLRPQAHQVLRRRLPRRRPPVLARRPDLARPAPRGRRQAGQGPQAGAHPPARRLIQSARASQ